MPRLRWFHVRSGVQRSPQLSLLGCLPRSFAVRGLPYRSPPCRLGPPVRCALSGVHRASPCLLGPSVRCALSGLTELLHVSLGLPFAVHCQESTELLQVCALSGVHRAPSCLCTVRGPQSFSVSPWAFRSLCTVRGHRDSPCLLCLLLASLLSGVYRSSPRASL